MSDAWIDPGVLTVCLFGSGGSLLSLATLLVPGLHRRRLGAVVGLLGLAVLLLGAAAAAALGQPPSVWLAPLSLAGSFVVCRVLRTEAATRTCLWLLARAADPRLQGVALLSAGLLVVFQREQEVERHSPVISENEYAQLGALPPNLRELQGVDVVTDRGRHIPMMGMPEDEDSAAPLSAERELAWVRDMVPALRLLRTGPPDRRCNCHGWTFTGGRYLIHGADVPTILADNDYQPVSVPQPGDLIVYRDSEGTRVLHTGIVRTAGPDAPLLIESKWGLLGRYVHAPESQPYGPHFTYYRSARPGHLLQGLDGDPVRKTSTVSAL